jgi:conjugative transfer region lipoprotein (TIGR03751 family)
MTACSNMSGNVVPQNGPTMEDVYDSVKAENKSRNDVNNKLVSLPVSNRSFHKLPNPELKMYVYPHLSSKDEVPIPGYYTVFNAYYKDYYVLPNEEVRNLL